MKYPIRLKPEDDGTIFVSSVDFPEMHTWGEDRTEALSRAIDALETAIQGRISDREDVPPPGRGRTTVRLPTQSALKVMLYQAMRQRGVTKAELARRLTWHKPQVDRLLDLRHASRHDQLDAAFAGRRYDAELLDDLPSTVDPCGENGEFHTLCTHAPCFTAALDVAVGEAIEREGFVYCDLTEKDQRHDSLHHTP